MSLHAEPALTMPMFSMQGVLGAASLSLYYFAVEVIVRTLLHASHSHALHHYDADIAASRLRLSSVFAMHVVIVVAMQLLPMKDAVTLFFCSPVSVIACAAGYHVFV
jgi:hypothetical protein